MFVLVKGIDTLTKPSLPTYGDDSLCVATLSAQCHQRLDVSSGNALLGIFTAGELTAAHLYLAGKRHSITPTRWQSLDVLAVHWQGVELQVCVAAGKLPAVQALAKAMQGRVLVLSLATLLGMRWCDGYLAHLNAGKILSYAARPGYLCLRLPIAMQGQGIEHLSASLQQDTEYLALQEALKFYARRKQLPPTPSLCIDDFSLAAAVCLVAAVKVLACTAVQLKETPNPAWKRLLQNLGISTVSTGKLPLSQLLPLLKAQDLARIAAAINRKGAIIPDQFIRRLATETGGSA